jgi:DNA polymerase-3 subunit beta
VTIAVEGALLDEMIEKTIYSVTMEEAGFKLSGVFMERVEREGESFLRMVATDGHRLSLIDKKVPDLQGLEIEDGVMIPKKGLTELSRLASEEGAISFGLKQNNLVAKKEKALIVLRLLDTKFPDYKSVIPKRDNKENLIPVSRRALLEAMRRMMIMRSDQYQGVKVNVESEYLEILSVNPDLGNAEEKVEIKYGGHPMEMGFNPRYFIDALQPMESEVILLNIKDQTSPCLITGESDEGFLGLIMPMRI